MKVEKDKAIQIIEPKTTQYVLAGERVKLVGNSVYGTRLVYEGVGYLLSQWNKPTRSIDDANIIELQDYEVRYSYENRACIYRAGMELHLIKKSDAEKYLLDHPLPRKAISKKTRESVYAKFSGHCAYCGREIAMKEMQVDHIVSHMSHGGDDSEENYYPACSVCNRVKSSSTIEGFRNGIRNCARIHHGRKPRDQHIYADSDKIAEYYNLLGEDWKDRPIVFYFEKQRTEE